MKGLSQKIYDTSPVWLQNLLVSAYGFHLYRKRYVGPVYHQAKALIERVNSMSLAEQRAYQGEQLHAIIRHSRANVPYYGRLLADLGLTEQDFTEPEHVKKLPILTKQQLLKNPDDFKSRGSRPYMVQHTSGSTGTPLSLWVDEFTYKLAMALLIDHEERHGVQFGERRATFAGRMIQPIDKMKPPFSRYNRAENQRIFSAYHLNAETFPYYLTELEKFEPKEIIGYPSAIHELATLYQESGRKPAFKPTAIITNSETLLDWQRNTIESVFSCPVRDYYGTAEYVTFASQCDSLSYHFNSSIGITELSRDKHTFGETGRLTASTLTNKAMPLIRYDLGDIAKLPAEEECTCGNSQFHTNQIIGRIDDYLLASDGRRIGRIDHIFKGLSNIKEAQVEQLEIDKFKVALVLIDNRVPVERSLLIENLKKRLGENIEVKVVETNYIQRGKNGKFKSVIGLQRK